MTRYLVLKYNNKIKIPKMKISTVFTPDEISRRKIRNREINA